MEFITTVTQKGQVTIPVAMRKKAGIGTRKWVRITYRNNALNIQPVNDLMSLSGSIRTKRKLDTDALREMFENRHEG